ncbi:MAG: TlpA family protein disulfide reductase [Verrucomicrobiales bacterium]|nr:TlpA family protein disulfide reductase [Verrucomicrobiales bacterium]
MKLTLVPVLLAAFLGTAPLPAQAADTPAQPAPEKTKAQTQLEALVDKIRAKLDGGQPTETALADEIKQFDALLAEHKNEKTPDVAQILMMKATLYLEVFENEAKGTELLEQLRKDFPDTPQASFAATMISSLQKQASLAVGKTFPDFQEKDLDGQPLSLANYKGKVVLVDFWATWCGPCLSELPNVQAAYRKHHDRGFDIVGISLDSDREKLTNFIKQKELPWKQYFDGQGWKTKLAQDYGINSIPATYLLDGTGKIIARNLRGPALDTAVAEALAAAAKP